MSRFATTFKTPLPNPLPHALCARGRGEFSEPGELPFTIEKIRFNFFCMKLSTLKRYIEAMGGELDIVARFASNEVHLNVAEL